MEGGCTCLTTADRNGDESPASAEGTHYSWQMICFVLSRRRRAFAVNCGAARVERKQAGDEICFSADGTNNTMKLRLISSPAQNRKQPADKS